MAHEIEQSKLHEQRQHETSQNAEAAIEDLLRSTPKDLQKMATEES